ncbi:ankyrin repeat and SAM domain-containing protein 3 isoform X2 [Anabrus simplex]|uniref:ankyrin repeat and SAM domain-containing protein 3 isoform X2 n=1 Tax=Anabrus simplex TaxID=316456 RepID=UPI0034DD9D6E
MAAVPNDAVQRSDEEGFDSWPDFMYTTLSLDLWNDEPPAPAPIGIHMAASLGDIPHVLSLMRSDQVSYNEINGPNRSGWTPLMYACSGQHEDMATLLLEVGVDANRPGKNGLTALMVAARGCNMMILVLLLNVAHVDARDDNGWTALFHAVDMEQEQSMQWLITYGANVNAMEPSTGRTILMLAAKSARISVIERLLRHGADPYATSWYEETALSIAENSQNQPVAELLRKITCISRKKPNSLRELLAFIGYEKYWPRLRDQGVDLEVFLSLSEADLKELGVDKVGPRKVMAKAIDTWRSTK